MQIFLEVETIVEMIVNQKTIFTLNLVPYSLNYLI